MKMVNVMEQVESFLKRLGLGEYVDACELNGYEHLGCILEHDEGRDGIFGVD